MTRTTYFKAANVDLAAPYYAGRGGLYLPGTEHTPDYLDPDSSKSCTHGLYFCSHQRVAARWGPVVLQVAVLGEKIKTDERVRPSKQPDGIRATKYNKYRTDRMRILRIVGVTGYAGDLDWGKRLNRSDKEQSREQALENVRTLNTALIRAGLLSVTFPDRVLERLRDDRFNLWEIEDPNAVVVSRETSRRKVVQA